LVAAVLVLIGPVAAVESNAAEAAAPNARIQVRVTDESGAPVIGAKVTARLTWKTKPSVEATSTFDGIAELPGLRADELYMVRVNHIDYAVAEVDVVPARLQESQPVTVRLFRDLCDTLIRMDGEGWRRLIDPDRAKTSTVFSAWFLTGLPGGGGTEAVLEECDRRR